PHSSGSTGASADRVWPEALRVAMPLASAGKAGSALSQPGGGSRLDKRSNRALRSGVFAAPSSKETCHPAWGPLPASARCPAGVGEGLRLERELHGRVEAEDLLGGRDLGVAERGAVRGAGVLLVRRRPADDRAQRDHGRLVGDRPRGLVGGQQRLDVLVVAAV